MMKCPKCSFEQPPDTYCAQCGVNMETFKPMPVPKWRLLATNWMVHLAVLITVIVSLVLYDRDKKPRSTAQQQTTTSQAAYRRNKPLPAEAPAEEIKVAAAPARETRPAPFQKSLNTEAFSSQAVAEPPLPAPAKPAVPANIQGMTVSFYQATRGALSELQKDSRTISIGGDGMGGILSKKQFADLQSDGEIKNVSKNPYKSFEANQPITIFKGQRNTITSKNIGLTFQITPLKKEPTSAALEVKAWSNIQDSNVDAPLFSSEMTLNSLHLGFIAGFLPKERQINDEEKILFESDRTLKIYNSAAFWDDALDLIMVIEFTDKP